MAMEMMGLHMPGAAFVPPKGDLRRLLTEAAVTWNEQIHRALVEGSRWQLGAELQRAVRLPTAALVIAAAPNLDVGN